MACYRDSFAFVKCYIISGPKLNSIIVTPTAQVRSSSVLLLLLISVNQEVNFDVQIL
jgi:hypothetical protein